MASSALAHRCVSNQFTGLSEEICGPTGFCYVLWKGNTIIERGCDHAFLCEVRLFRHSPAFSTLKTRFIIPVAVVKRALSPCAIP